MRGLERLRSAVALGRARARGCPAAASREAQAPGADGDRYRCDADHGVFGEGAGQGNFKGGFVHHPLLAYLDETGEAPAGILRPGNAGSNTAADRRQVLDLALGQLDPRALEGEKLRPQRPTATASKVASVASARLSEPLPAS